MKKSPLATVLLVILTVSALLSVVQCWMYISAARELRMLQTQAAMVNNNQALINALAAETFEYSKKNPAIDPILEAAGIKPKAGAPATNRPATK
jgi:hypothetical protein